MSDDPEFPDTEAFEKAQAEAQMEFRHEMEQRMRRALRSYVEEHGPLSAGAQQAFLEGYQQGIADHVEAQANMADRIAEELPEEDEHGRG